MEAVKDYWNALYSENMDACKWRVINTSEDFLAALRGFSDELYDVFHNANSVIEFGCGTGYMSQFFRRVGVRFLGVDICDVSIDYANKNFSDEFTRFACVDIQDVDEKFDVSYSSNTLEHFKDPYLIIDKLLSISDVLFITVPYDQKDLEDYNGEGGAGHVFSFNKDSFSQYDVLLCETYFTHTWAHGLQLLVVLKKNK